MNLEALQLLAGTTEHHTMEDASHRNEAPSEEVVHYMKVEVLHSRKLEGPRILPTGEPHPLEEEQEIQSEEPHTPLGSGEERLRTDSIAAVASLKYTRTDSNILTEITNMQPNTTESSMEMNIQQLQYLL